MVITTKTNKTTEKAQGYLNLEINDKHGNVYKVPCYIPINGNSDILNAMLLKAKKAEEEGEPCIFALTGSVHVVKETSADDIEL